MNIDWQDLNDKIVVRIWRTNDVEKHAAELCADIAISEFKKLINANKKDAA